MLLKLVCILALIKNIVGLGEIIFAVNAGGDNVVDSHGIRYKRDILTTGVASDYGKSLDIKRASPSDKILYQTERYSSETFGYTIPISDDGDYVLWLKFSEVWFNAPNQKVFDIAINDVVVVKDLDIFAQAGRGIAHDVVVPFKIKQKKLIIEDRAIAFNYKIRVDFVKTELDNPKVNAIIVMKGTVDQVPALEPYEPNAPNPDHFDEDEEREENYDEEEQENLRRRMREMKDDDEEQERERNKRKKPSSSVKTSEPVVEDPYAADETSYLIPVLVAIGAFIPLLFCLCKI